MADKSVGELIAAQSVTPTDLFVLEQNGTAKKLTGQVLENWLVSFADGHGGIQSIVKQSTSGLKDTYRITLADTTTFDFIVTNGKAISSVQQTSKNVLTRTYTIAFNDGTSQTFTVTDGRSITDIAKTGTNVLTDTYTISYNDGTTSTFTVKNGKGIKAFAKVSTVGLVDTYRIDYTDNSSSEFTVTNGAKGDKGDNSYVWIKYSSQEPTESSHSIGDIPDDWIGIYYGNASKAPTDWKQYKWFKHKGEKGDTGSPAALVTKSVNYQVGDSGTIIPSGVWGSSIPVVSQGKYLWTKTELRFNTGDPIVSYSVARMGVDGSGSVSSVAGVSPDATGNVTLTAADVGALAVSGGDMTGAIDMNGQPISGLNDPTEDTQAARKGYVDSVKEEAKSYTDTAVRKAVPRNMLDNSDFRNPVNQRGYRKWTPEKKPETGADANTYYGFLGGYTIDRWVVHVKSGIFSVLDGYIRLEDNTENDNHIRQNIDMTFTKETKVTFAIKARGSNFGICHFGTSATKSSYNDWTVIVYTYTIPSGTDLAASANYNPLITWSKGCYAEIEWAALYEGAYTAETLPEYHPKGYGAELAECQRYYQIRSANNIAAVDMRPTMRLSSPTITSVTGGYAYSADL